MGPWLPYGGHAETSIVRGVRWLLTTSRKTYFEAFKRGAVLLYESGLEVMINVIASDLESGCNFLCTWLDTLGTVAKTNTDGEKVAGPIAAAANSDRASLKDSLMPTYSRAGVGERQALRRTRDPTQGGEVFRGRDVLVNRFRFIDDHRGLYQVKRLSAVLGINRSSCYKWKSTAPARRCCLVADAVLGAQITAENGCYKAKNLTESINASEDHSADGVAA